MSAYYTIYKYECGTLKKVRVPTTKIHKQFEDINTVIDEAHKLHKVMCENDLYVGQYIIVYYSQAYTSKIIGFVSIFGLQIIK